MSLRLDCHGDSWSQREQDGEQHSAWVAVRQAHRAAVLSVLRAMPQLQRVDCPTLWPRPGEAASLTALTSLSVGGLLPSSLASLAAPETAVSQSTTDAMWPPRLQELTLHSGGSPRLLAALQLPATLRTFACHTIRFGMLDVEVSNRIKQETLDSLGPAVQLLVRTKRPNAVDRMEVVADGAPGLLRPRERGPRGHAEWLQQLAGLDVFSGIELNGMKLRAGDVISLVSTLPNLRDFVLRGSRMPAAALPCLAGLAQLLYIWVDLSRDDRTPRKELEAALCVLCHQAPMLSEVIVKVPVGDADACGTAVVEQLEATGRDHIQVHIWDDS